MPVLPAAPTSGPIAPGHREPLAQLMQPHPMRGVAATAKNITTAAIQQGQALTKSDMSAPRPVLNPQDKRHRLVGPPPSFEVNVIQHLRESLVEPQASPDNTGNSGARAEENWGDVPHSAYHILSESSAPPAPLDTPDDIPEMHVNISL